MKSSWRAALILVFLLIFGATVVGRLVFVQIIDHGYYKALAQGQQQLSTLIKGDRGSIVGTDKYGNLYTYAVNHSSPLVFVTPPEIENKEETLQTLSTILDIEIEKMAPALEKEKSLYQILKKGITKEEATLLIESALPGVYIGAERTRYYPQNTMASRILGFTNQEGIGQYGIEEYHNAAMEGKEGLEKADLLKVKREHLVKIADLLPQDASDVNKIFVDVSLNEEETNKILELVKSAKK